MSYRTRPGIVLVRICDTDLLVATRAEWEKCPVLRPIPKLWAACWRVMENGKTDKEVVEAFSSLLKKPEEEVRGRLNRIFVKLASEGLLTEDRDEDQ